MHIYNLASCSSGTGVRVFVQAIRRRSAAASGRQTGRVAGVRFSLRKLSVRESGPESLPSSMPRVYRNVRSESAALLPRGPRRIDRVVSTTVVNLGIFYLAANYNVEPRGRVVNSLPDISRALVLFSPSPPSSRGGEKKREVTQMPARSRPIPGKNDRALRQIKNLHATPRQFSGAQIINLL